MRRPRKTSRPERAAPTPHNPSIVPGPVPAYDAPPSARRHWRLSGPVWPGPGPEPEPERRQGCRPSRTREPIRGQVAVSPPLLNRALASPLPFAKAAQSPARGSTPSSLQAGSSRPPPHGRTHLRGRAGGAGSADCLDHVPRNRRWNRVEIVEPDRCRARPLKCADTRRARALSSGTRIGRCGLGFGASGAVIPA